MITQTFAPRLLRRGPGLFGGTAAGVRWSARHVLDRTRWEVRLGGVLVPFLFASLRQAGRWIEGELKRRAAS